VVFHTDFFTRIITSRLKKRKINIFKTMYSIFNRAALPKVNMRIERSLVNQGFRKKTLNLLANEYKDLSLSSIFNKDWLLLLHSVVSSPAEKLHPTTNNNLGSTVTELLNKWYYNIIKYNKNLALAGETLPWQRQHKDYSKIYEIIFNSINYKNLSGMRLEVKGRLTKRYRADRALFNVKWKGGLRNIDSSYKGLSSVTMRGHVKPNVDYSIFTAKRRIGAFAVKGWLSGKN